MKRFHAYWAGIFTLILLPLICPAQPLWESLQGPQGGYINSMAANPAGDLFIVAGWDKVYKTEDHGGTWTEIPFPGAQPIHLFILADGILLMHAGSGMWQSPDEGVNWNFCTYDEFVRVVETGEGAILGGSESGIFKSADEGLHWTPAGLPQLNVWDMTANGPDEVFACGMGTTGAGVVYKSGDSGENWELILESPPGSYGFSSIAFLPSGTLLAAGADLLYRSSDGGLCWEALPNPGFAELWVLQDGKLFGTSGNLGILASEDEGSTWSCAGFDDENVHWIEEDPENWMFAGVGAKGLARRHGELSGWEFANHGIVATSIDRLAMDDSGILYALALPASLYARSAADGAWSEIQLPEDDYKFLYTAPGNTLIVSGLNHMSVSSDGGGTWTLIDDFGALKMDFFQDGTWLAAGHFWTGSEVVDGLFRSADKGQTWANISPPLGGEFHCIDLLVTADNTVLISYQDYIYPMVRRSADMGSTWEESVGLSGIHFAVLAEGPDRLYAAGENTQTLQSDTYQSFDGGLSWEFIEKWSIWFSDLAVSSSGQLFANTSGNILVYHPEGPWWKLYGIPEFSCGWCSVNMLLSPDDRLYVAYPSQGVWRTAGPTTPVYEPLARSIAIHVTPNPVSSETKVDIHLPEAAEVLMECVNAAGQAVFQTYKRELPPGNHQMPLVTGNLPCGVYFLQVFANQFSGVVKMVVH